MIKCRACLKHDGCMVPFSDQNINYFYLLTNINVQMCDNLPQHLCFCCLDIIKSYIEFREKCITSNYVLIESLEIKPKIGVELIRDKDFKTESSIDSIDDILKDDLVDKNKHLDYDSLTDLIKTENTEEQLSASQSNTNAKKHSKANEALNNTSFELKIKNAKKTKKSSKTIAIKKKETVFPCGLCSETFPEASLVSNHLSSHKTSNKCNLCSLKCTEWPELLSHRLIHLTNKDKRCHICLKRFYKPLNMEYHYRKFHSGDSDYILKCSECTHTFKTPRKLQKHMWSSHSDKMFLCDHCPKVFKSKNAIKTHMAIHNTQHHLSCDICDYSCRFSSNLKDHKLRKHTPKKAYCKKCTRVFSDQEKLEAHKCGERGTVCPTCGKIVKTHRQLMRHMLSHDSTRRYKCERCPNDYRSRAALATHLLVHDGRRTKHCRLCHAAFYSASVLNKHTRTHTGEKPYVCRVCCRAFTGNYNLKVHMRVHGEYLIEKRRRDDDSDI